MIPQAAVDVVSMDSDAQKNVKIATKVSLERGQ